MEAVSKSVGRIVWENVRHVLSTVPVSCSRLRPPNPWPGPPCSLLPGPPSPGQWGLSARLSRLQPWLRPLSQRNRGSAAFPGLF